ncbi:MAG: TonB-dependent receptor, partial [Planctomycetia bacterium]|nr:TonB-dependent receptor [Planctomycetia bacterium]
TSSTASLIDRANQATGKVEHRWSDKFTTTGFYAWYDSVEPEARFYAKNLGENPGEPAEGQLFRTVHAVAINNIITISNNTVFAFRYGYTQFVDDDIPNQFDPAGLGFSQNFLSAIPYKKFPRFAISGYGTVNFDTFGDRDPQDTTFYGHNVSASVSKLFGRHTLKGGFDFRVIGMKLFARGQPSGRFSFDSAFTRGPNPLVGGALQHSLAGFLLGFPSSGDITIGTPNNFYINYYAGYVHDDFRVGPNLTLNLGLRYEFEQGLQERDNLLTVGFSRDKAFPVQVPGLNLKGGLLYAGVDGAPTHQNDPSKKKFAPRVGLAYKFSDKVVLRGGYGIFYAPNQYAFPNENRMGTRGFTAVTTYVASTDGGLTPCSTCTLTNPFPNGVEKPVGSSLGLLTGAGGNIHFVDQLRESAYVHQYSADLQYELARGTVVSAGYVGARSEKLS